MGSFLSFMPRKHHGLGPWLIKSMLSSSATCGFHTKMLVMRLFHCKINIFPRPLGTLTDLVLMECSGVGPYASDSYDPSVEGFRTHTGLEQSPRMVIPGSYLRGPHVVRLELTLPVREERSPHRAEVTGSRDLLRGRSLVKIDQVDRLKGRVWISRKFFEVHRFAKIAACGEVIVSSPCLALQPPVKGLA